MPSLFDLTGKVALITGSSRGIGRAIAEAMAQHGATVVVSSRKAEACEQVAQHINHQLCADGPGSAIVVPCNISSKPELENLVQETERQLGRIDILVCNAAVNPFFGPSAQVPDSAFEKILQCNLTANHWLTQMVAPTMAERGDGVIILISSIGGLRGSSTLGAYAISKAADMQLVRNLAVEYGGGNVRANAIAPGLIQTDFARALWENPDILAASTAHTPLKRIGQPDEISGAAVFLASRAGQFMTGQTLVIDGGTTIA